jgi:hypothetical protein
MDSYVIIGRFLSYFGQYFIKYINEKVTCDRALLGPMATRVLGKEMGTE